MKSTIFDQGGRPKPQAMPVTISLVALIGISFLVCWFVGTGSGVSWILENLAISEKNFLAKPWTLVTYPFAFGVSDFISTLFACYWCFVIGSRLEKDLGSGVYAGFLVITTILHGLCVVLAALAFHAETRLLMPFIITASITVLWGSRYRDEEIRVFFVIPVKAMWIAIITVAATLFGYGYGNPIMGVAVVLPFGLTALYGLNKLPFAYGPIRTKVKNKKAEKEFTSFIDNVRTREKEREERERLRKLFESSLSDEDKK